MKGFEGYRVLLADDEEIDLEVVSHIVEDLGAECVKVRDGDEMLDMLTAADTNKFDFVLTDAWMPVMTGMELVAAIRANPMLAPLPVYLFTAEVEMKDIYAEKGFDAILLKPANLEALKKLLP